MRIMGLISGVVGFAVGASLAYYFREDIEKAVKPKKKSKESSEQPKVSKEVFDMSQAEEEMKQNASIFYGCYNGLLSVADGTTKYSDAIIKDWHQRLSDEKKFPMLHRYWNSLFKPDGSMTDQQCSLSAQQFMRFIEKCGIRHDTIDSQIRIEEETKKWYGSFIEDEANWQIGEIKKVKTPAWYFGSTILEKGFLY